MKIPPQRPSEGYMSVALFELRALQLYAGLMEEQIRAVERWNAEPGLPEPQPGWGIREQLTEAAAQQMVPNVMRRAMLLSLYSLLEQTLRMGIGILDRIHDGPEFQGGREFLKKASRHLREVHEFDPVREVSNPHGLWVLEALRHAFVHGGGSKGTVDPSNWRRLERLREGFRGFDLDRNFVMLSPELFERLHEPVYELVLALVAFVRKRVDAAAGWVEPSG